MPDAHQTVERFAKALDAENYDVAASVLAADCSYSCRGESYHGPSEIIDAYRGNGDAAKMFDAVTYSSTVTAVSDYRFRVVFVDHLEYGGRQLTFRSEQIIEIGDFGMIVRIEHHDLPGQVEALAQFKKVIPPWNHDAG